MLPGSFCRKRWRKHGTKATILVAQRISAVMHCDHILVIDEGEIIGAGTHEELLDTCEIYREIADSQLGGAFE